MQHRISELDTIINWDAERIYIVQYDIPLSTIYYPLRQEGNRSRPQSGAPRNLIEDRDHIDELMMQDPYI